MGPHAGQPVLRRGTAAGPGARSSLIMVHGRNAGPENILDLVPRLARPDVTYLAPAAANRTWYPYSFMADIASNEPGPLVGARGPRARWSRASKPPAFRAIASSCSASRRARA